MIGPVPWQQFINPVDLVIVYAVENVGKVSLWIDGVQLGGFDDRHRTCQGFRPGVSTRKEPVFAPDGQFPFILPMSGQFIACITGGTRILVPMLKSIGPIGAAMGCM